MNPLTGRQQGEGCELRAECSQSKEAETVRITLRMHECENGKEEQKRKKKKHTRMLLLLLLITIVVIIKQ